ncbi:hypothetical protein A2U01_0108284, partial [Trifolium medium]|nr:hypothetical protein [Trifolium medium]
MIAEESIIAAVSIIPEEQQDVAVVVHMLERDDTVLSYAMIHVT